MFVQRTFFQDYITDPVSSNSKQIKQCSQRQLNFDARTNKKFVKKEIAKQTREQFVC